MSNGTKPKIPGEGPARIHKGKEEALEIVQQEKCKRLNVILPESVYVRFRKKKARRYNHDGKSSRMD